MSAIKRPPFKLPVKAPTAKLAAAGLLLIALSGCSALERVGMKLLFDPTPWPEDRALEDLAYIEDEDADPAKHRLDFFLPEGEGWSTLLFVHGGSWRWGDKDLEVGGREVYGNIGRFYASKGIGVAVISYRLQPTVDWREQVADVAAAIRFVADEASKHGGDGESLFLAGHSAGAQLVSYAALADWPLSPRDRERLCGVVAISGAGYDLADEKTYELGADPTFYEETFRDGESGDQWQEKASSLTFLGPDRPSPPPPFLVFFAEKEHEALHRQAALMHRGIEESGAPSRLVEVPRVSHRRIVVEFSQEDAVLAPAVMDFVEANRGCRAGSSAGPASAR